jgi:hypothetical protein
VTSKKPERNPLCVYERCQRHGVIEAGEPEALDGCVNTPLRCTTCGATGERSERTDQA